MYLHTLPFLPLPPLTGCCLQPALQQLIRRTTSTQRRRDATNARYASCAKAKAWLAPTSGCLAQAGRGLLVGASLPEPDPPCCAGALLALVSCGLALDLASASASADELPGDKSDKVLETLSTLLALRPSPPSLPPAPAPLPLAPGRAGRPQAAAGDERGGRAQRARDRPRLRPRRQDAHLRLTRQVDRSVGCRAPRRRGRCPLLAHSLPYSQRTYTYWSSSH